jgi:hypothetical protein
MWRHALGFGLSLCFFVLCGCSRNGGAVPQRYQPSSLVEIWSDENWGAVLNRVVTEDGYVRYDLLTQNTDGVRDDLYRFVGQINQASPENRPELFPGEIDQLAYYVNAYNALSLYGVLERRLPANVYLSGLLHDPYFVVGGRRVSLDQLENRIRRFGDPRVHFALNCATRSSPPLRREPYEGSKLDQQLDEQGERFLDDARAVQVVDQDTVRLTELITRFYPEDYLQAYERQTGTRPVNIIEAVAPYAPEDSPLLDASDYEALPYDWSLNRARESG